MSTCRPILFIHLQALLFIYYTKFALKIEHLVIILQTHIQSNWNKCMLEADCEEELEREVFWVWTAPEGLDMFFMSVLALYELGQLQIETPNADYILREMLNNF